MSDAKQQPQTPPKKSLATHIGRIAEGASFIIFIAVLTLQNGPALAFGAVWTVVNLGLLILWPGVFSFAIPRSLGPDEDSSARDREPRSLSVPAFAAISLGVPGALNLFGIDEPSTALVTLGLSALAGAILFAAVYALDPLIRTAKQMLLLAVESLLWGLGALMAAALLLDA